MGAKQPRMQMSSMPHLMIAQFGQPSVTSATLSSLKAACKPLCTTLITSTPAGPRAVKGTVSVGRGEASGTLIHTYSRAKDLSNLWPHAIFQTGRISDALASFGQTQLRIIAPHGYHGHIPNHLGLHEILFDEVLAWIPHPHDRGGRLQC